MRKIYSKFILLIGFFSCLFFSIALFAKPSGRLIFAADLIRHGARTALHPLGNRVFPAMWSLENIGFGQLTQYGFYEEANNGRYFKKTYRGLLSEAKPLSQQLCWRSDGSNRDIVSTLGVIAGWFPEEKNPVIETVPEKEDILLHVPAGYAKPLAALPGWRLRWHSPMGYALAKRLQKAQLLNHICPEKIKGHAYQRCFLEPGRVGSTFLALRNYCQHQSSRCNTLRIAQVTPKIMQQSIALFDWAFLHRFVYTQDTGFKAYRTAYLESTSAEGGIFIAEMIHNLQQVIQHKTPTKYILYASHDSTLLSALGFLIAKTPKFFMRHLPVQGDPEFAADLSFRLYQDAKKRYTLQVVFRNGSHDNQPEVPIYLGSFARFKKAYDEPQLLAKLDKIRRCDYL